MNLSASEMMTVEAEIRVPIATAQLVRFHMIEPADNTLRDDDAYWVDLCLTPRPRNTRACYRNRWAPNRFERLGNVFLVPPHEVMQARSDGGSTQSSVLCHLSPEPIRQWLEGDLEWTDRRLEASLDIHDVNIRGLLLRLAEEMRHPGFASDVLVELIAAQMAIELGRYCAAIKEGPARRCPNSRNSAICRSGSSRAASARAAAARSAIMWLIAGSIMPNVC
jgi:AraC family transcriptional regulator